MFARGADRKIGTCNTGWSAIAVDSNMGIGDISFSVENNILDLEIAGNEREDTKDGKK